MISRLRKRYRSIFSNWLEKRLPLQHSITLNQSRIFIVPTLQGLLLLVVAMLVLLLAINFESSLNFSLSFWLISMLWVAVHLTYRNLSGLTIAAKSGNLVEVGEIAEVTILLSSTDSRNRGIIELINENWGVVQVEMSKASVAVTLPILARGRGPVLPPRFRLESRFPFGLIVAWTNVKIDAKAWAYPKSKKYNRTREGLGFDPEQEAMDDHFYRPGNEDFHSLKNYVPGDPIHRLHWPGFSRGQLLVKAFTDYQASDDSIDWDQFPGLASEDRLAAIRYYSESFFSDGRPYDVRLPDVHIPTNKGIGHLTDVRRALAEFGHD